MDEQHISEPGLVAVDVPAADEGTLRAVSSIERASCDHQPHPDRWHMLLDPASLPLCLAPSRTPRR
ncbi:DUF6207 family protein [Streptomyces fradiae]|uniref:DUF6207 family protein n=1 Tax=Streptomyces fradiae TaxID=1906 RepID=UPI0035BE59E3